MGGGAIYSSLLICITKFSPKTSFHISNFIILFTAIVVFYLGLKKKESNSSIPLYKNNDSNLSLFRTTSTYSTVGYHYIKNNTFQYKFINYDVILCFSPMMAFGSKIGEFLHRVLPAIILNFFLFVFIVITTLRYYNKYLASVINLV